MMPLMADLLACAVLVCAALGLVVLGVRLVAADLTAIIEELFPIDQGAWDHD